LHDSLPRINYYNEQGIPVKGKIQRAFSKKAATGKLKILTKAGHFLFVDADSLGRFYTSDLVYFDSTEIIIQTENDKGKNAEFKFQLEPFNPYFPSRYAVTAFDSAGAAGFWSLSVKSSSYAKQLNFTKGTTVLEAVEVTAKRTDGQPQKKFLGSTIYDMKKMGTANNVIQTMQGRLPGFDISGVPPNMKIASLRNPRLPVTYLLNGNMIIDIDFVNGMSPQDIESIEVLSGAQASIYRSSAAISFNLKQGSGTRVTQGLHNIKYPGYNIAREFYTPRYEVQEDSHKLEDVRTTLYWNPKVTTDSTGRTKVSFFTSDISSGYRVEVEGITADGRCGSQAISFKVE
jgi:hypothetical protein